jgi:hypothetical protein
MLPPPPPETIHIAFDDGPYRMQMGLVAQDPRDLIEIDEHYPAQMAERRRLLAERHGEVFWSNWPRCCRRASPTGSRATARSCATI